MKMILALIAVISGIIAFLGSWFYKAGKDKANKKLDEELIAELKKVKQKQDKVANLDNDQVREAMKRFTKD
jgi:hypothetical protein